MLCTLLNYSRHQLLRIAPAYEVAAFIRNPLPEILEHPLIIEIIAHRLENFSHLLDLEKKRLQQWCFVQSVLSWAWALEDKIDPAYFKHLTEIFNHENLEAPPLT